MAQGRGKHRQDPGATQSRAASTKGFKAGKQVVSSHAAVAASNGRGGRHNRSGAERLFDFLTPAGTVGLAICLLMALIMTFGHGFIWADTAQLRASNYAEGTDPQDFDFIDGISNGKDTDQVTMVSNYLAYSQSDNKNRVKNIQLAAAGIDGVLLHAGDTLSFKKAVGELTKENGYVDAPISGSEGTTSTVGGGASQVASALYIAALRAGLTVEERAPHSDVVDFVPLGQDANIYVSDLVIYNNTGRDMYIRATADGQSVEVKIYVANNGSANSAADMDITYEVVTEITDTKDVAASKEFDNLAARGLNPTDVLKRYEVKTYLVKYVSGIESSRTLIGEDSYLAFPSSEITSK